MKYLLLIIPLFLIGQPPMEDIEQPPPPGDIGPMAESGPDIAAFSDLSQAERTKIEDIMYKTQVEMIKLRSQIKLKRLDLMKEMKADKPSLAKIKTMVKNISNLEAQAKIIGIERMLKIRDIVGPEKWEQMKHSRAKKMRKFIRQRRTLR